MPLSFISLAFLFKRLFFSLSLILLTCLSLFVSIIHQAIFLTFHLPYQSRLYLNLHLCLSLYISLSMSHFIRSLFSFRHQVKPDIKRKSFLYLIFKLNLLVSIFILRLFSNHLRDLFRLFLNHHFFQITLTSFEVFDN